ncbi:MAG: 3-deoxy-D-manno-octulosonic acid transferase, partial [Candidatus Latescibacteria bacterium]|nr:3-deoxy-D-manno-octulosonic acid transferase [Candidatus Latescibacterota bacterium]
MMYFLYAFLATLLAFLASPVLAIAGMANWRGMRHRVGILPAVNGSSDRPVIWFHAASVGEVAGLTAIVSAFIRVQPDWRVVVSTMTRTGLDHARRMVPDVHGLCLVPLDVPIIVRRAFVRFSPRALVFVEGELWPCLIEEAVRSGCRVALVNGRMSDRSYPRYRTIRRLTRRMLSRLALLCAQTETDANRFIDCGASPDRVIVTGNVKVDLMSSTPPSSRTVLRQMLGLPEAEPVIIAGSTRPGEEEMVFEAFIAVRARHPEARLICAPRHLDRLPDVQRSLREHGLPFIRRSEIQPLSVLTPDPRPLT